MLRMLALAVLLVGLSLPMAGDAQMGWGGGHGMMGGPGMMRGSFVRRSFVMRYGVDPRYAGKVNPLPPTVQNMRAGQALYAQNCAACHGANGRGNGPAGANLNPPPANLIGIGRMPMITDGYLYWTIAEGGTQLHTAMPPFKGALSEKQIWQLVLFLRHE